MAATFAIGAGGVSSASPAAVLSASVGGVPVGAGVYESFDSAASGFSAQGIMVTFSGTGAM
ncbi:MAG: hypothetical protein ABJA60_08070 [Nitrosospira sp.]